MLCLRPCAVGRHGRKGSLPDQGSQGRPEGAVPAFRAFCVLAGTGCRNQPTNPDTMLRPYYPQQTIFCITDELSVRGGVPSFSITETSAADNNLASKTPKSHCSRMFPEVGAEHMNSSRRSCVTYFFSAVPHPFFDLRNSISAKTSTNHLGRGPQGPPPHNPVRRSFEAGDTIQPINY